MSATLVNGLGTIGATEQITATKLMNLVNNATISGISNAEIASDAAVAYSKLNLATSIVNADIATDAAIALSKLAVTTLATGNAINIVLDGGGSALTTGVKLDVLVPFACTITQATVLADQSGSIVIDIWKDTYANYPPTVADTITASAKPTLSSAIKAQDSTLTGWTTSIAAGDTLRINIDSITTCTRVTLSLKVTRT
jgi:hypothetical protein